MKFPIISDNERQQDFYEVMRKRGESHRTAEMCAMRAPPRCSTDNVFAAGLGTLEQQFSDDPEGLQHVTKAAMKKGYKPNPNDIYLPTLANSVGDPEAFVPATGAQGHITKVLEKRNWSSRQGYVTRQAEQREPKPAVRLAPDLVAEEMRNQIKADPAKAKIDKRDLAAEIIHKHGAPK